MTQPSPTAVPSSSHQIVASATDDASAGLDPTTIATLRALLALDPQDARAIRSRVARRRTHRGQNGPRTTYGDDE